MLSGFAPCLERFGIDQIPGTFPFSGFGITRIVLFKSLSDITGVTNIKSMSNFAL